MLRTGILAVLLLRDTVLARYMLWPCAVAYLGGALGDAPPLWPEHKNFLNTLNPKKI